MPMMQLNLRAQPLGLESHREFLRSEAVSWQGKEQEADLEFMCRGGQVLPAHQSVLVPLSPLLGTLCGQLSCGHVRPTVSVILDMESGVVRSLLDLVYSGTTALAPASVEDLKMVVKLLGLVFPGGFERVKPGEGEPAAAVKTSPSKKRVLSSPAASSESNNKIMRGATASVSNGLTVRGSDDSKLTINPVRQGASVTSSPARQVVSATDRMHMHVALTLQLKDAPSGSTALCKMPGCGMLLVYDQLSDHFLKHETEDRSRERDVKVLSTDNPITFPCVACGINFKFRRQLNSHTKNRHGSGGLSVKDKIDLLTDSSDDDDDDDARMEVDLDTNSVDSSSERLSEPVTNPPSKCEGVVPSSWHLPPSKHNFKAVPQSPIKPLKSSPSDTSNQCNVCKKQFKTVKAVSCHMLLKHPLASNVPSALSSNTLNTLPPSLQQVGGQSSSLSPLVKQPGQVRQDSAPLPANWKKFGCQICTKRFSMFCQLRTHYTLYHFWDQLSEEHENLGQECNICRLRFPTQDHLVQHMGNFHSLVDRHLVRRGLRMISSEKTIKLHSWQCSLCDSKLLSSSGLKAHLSVKHFQRELNAEFPVEVGKDKKCPKCYKLFEGQSVSTVIGHVGSFHDEVLKYAAKYLTMDQEDRDIIPVDDFDDDAIGIPIEEDTLKDPKSPKKSPSKMKIYPKGPFDCLTCQKCLITFSNARTLKIHYIRHYQTYFQSVFYSSTCPFCVYGKFPDVISTQKHVATAHEEQSLIPLMEQDGLWVNKSVVLDPGAAKLKRLGIPLKKVDKAIVAKHFAEMSTPGTQRESAASVARKQVHPCVVPSCTRELGTRAQFLIHLAVSHFWQRINSEFGTAFDSSGGGTCPLCRVAILNPDHERSVFFKHLAVEHEVVIKYLQEVPRIQMNSGTQVKNPFLVKDPQTQGNQVVKSQDHPMVKIHDQLDIKSQNHLTSNGNSASGDRSGKISPVLRFSKETVSDEEKKNNESEEESDEEIAKILKSRQKDTNVNSKSTDALENIDDSTSNNEAGAVKKEPEEENLRTKIMRDFSDSDSD